ncbi:hypothetical protein DOY81_006773 [Sarcophaga bullata]|nr:hypothetical protein DOY81_006773 [Sarcophaga bullata]
MSLQDESFPYDDDLEFSHNSGKSLAFPHHKRLSKALSHKEETVCNHSPAKECDITSFSCHDNSLPSSNDSSAPAETSGKTNASEPNDLHECDDKKSEFTRCNPNKSISYQDIHSEYTKRRYKHVESKVGQYIANIKALDKKKRDSENFQRHHSLPETLYGTNRNAQELNENCNKHNNLHYSENDLDRLNNTENYDTTTTATTSSSLSSKALKTDTGVFLDKETYEQFLNNRDLVDYLRSKLEEKNAENWRLKQNLDTVRIEFTICKDKLKQQSQAQRFSDSFGNINTAAGVLGRTSLQSQLYTRDTKEQAVQTDEILSTSPLSPQKKKTDEMFATPLTPDSYNNSLDHAAIGKLAPAPMKISKSVATIQPISLNFSNLAEQDSRDFSSSSINNTMMFLRQRSNSIATRKKSTPLPVNTSKANSTENSLPSCNDSAIHIEVSESPKSGQQQECVYYDKHYQPNATLQTRNINQSFSDGDVNSPPSSSGNKKNRKRQNLRSRMMRFFGVCTKCKDTNLTLDATINTQQRSNSQIPLLEKRS